jgi:hypothetical protein
MLSDKEAEKIVIGIEAAAKLLLEKCKELRSEVAPVTAAKKKNKELVNNSIETYYAKRRARAIKKQITENKKPL